MKYKYILFIIILWQTNLFAQHISSTHPIQTYIAEPLDFEKINIEDYERGNNDGYVYRIGVIDSVNINLFNAGTWFDLPNGDQVWYLKIHATDAKALNLYFDDFFIPQGAELNFYTNNFSEKTASYTLINNPDHSHFASEPIQGNTLILEYYEPKNVKNLGSISIHGINQVYRGLGLIEKSLDDRSGPCQVDVNCSEGDIWKRQRDGTVGMIVKIGLITGWCSGALVNNTAKDCTPYVLTAQHCNFDAENSTSTLDYLEWIFYFNYQKPNCGSGFSSHYTQVGCTLKAISGNETNIKGSDFCLVELINPLNELNTPYFLGWDATGTGSIDGICMHHPDGDVKKISTYTTPVNHSNWGSSEMGSHWSTTWVSTSNGHGTTEPGSSGAPLFNPWGLIIGQLTGGASDCTNPTQVDKFGKMSYNWNGSDNSQSLKLFLDPVGNGTQKELLGGYYLCSQGNGTINDIEENKELTFLVYPNPANEYFVIESTHAPISQIKIYNSSGVLVDEKLNIENNKIQISTEEYAKGIYFVEIFSLNEHKTIKLIIY